MSYRHNENKIFGEGLGLTALKTRAFFKGKTLNKAFSWTLYSSMALLLAFVITLALVSNRPGIEAADQNLFVTTQGGFIRVYLDGDEGPKNLYNRGCSHCRGCGQHHPNQCPCGNRCARI